MFSLQCRFSPGKWTNTVMLTSSDTAATDGTDSVSTGKWPKSAFKFSYKISLHISRKQKIRLKKRFHVMGFNRIFPFFFLKKIVWLHRCWKKPKTKPELSFPSFRFVRKRNSMCALGMITCGVFFLWATVLQVRKSSACFISETLKDKRKFLSKL